MEILSIIPARGGSKGIPRKNLKPILDKPLVAYTIEASLKSNFITKTIVSSEDDEIIEVSKKFGAEVIRRPDELAADVTKTAPVMLQVLNELEKKGYRADYVVLLQPTCPLRDEKYIDDAFKYYFEKQKQGYDSCFSAFSMGYTHAKWRILHNNKLESLYDFRIRPRRQETDEHYKMICENGAFYALPWDTLK
ncbi:acylneuraminate cytidylyltransferase family protein [bacterium]|nr:acylneuraminate cytidylyltransferase family protein [bacterium]